MDKKYSYSIKWKQPYASERAVIQFMLNSLHNTQLDMIDEATDRSDLSQAKELIDYIRSKA